MKPLPSVIIDYKGKISFERIGILLNDLKNQKAACDIHPVIYKKLLTLMIEMLENVLKYSDQYEDFIREHPQFDPVFTLMETKRGYQLLTRNPCRIRDIEGLEKRLQKINRSDEAKLKTLYRETITNGVFSEKGGAGLGFIEMAKISGNKLRYQFLPGTGEYQIFELILTIIHIP